MWMKKSLELSHVLAKRRWSYFPRRAFRVLFPRKLHRHIVQPASLPKQFSGFVFVCGLHRSGTTMVEHFIRAHFHVSGLRADVPESEGQHLQDVVPVARDHGGPGLFAFSPAMHLGAISGAAAEQAKDRLLRCWTPFVDGDEQVLLEKSPPNLTRIGWLRSVFPGALFVIVARDPRACAAATQKWAHTSIPELVYHWHVAYSAALDAWGDDCIAVRYEDFCHKPYQLVERIAESGKLPPREVPLDIEERFAQPKNSNTQYPEALDPVEFGPGAWDRLGPWF